MVLNLVVQMLVVGLNKNLYQSNKHKCGNSFFCQQSVHDIIFVKLFTIFEKTWDTLKYKPKSSKTSSKRALSPSSPKKVTNAHSANQKKVVLESVWKPGFGQEIKQLRILCQHVYRIIQKYKKLFIGSLKTLQNL